MNALALNSVVVQHAVFFVQALLVAQPGFVLEGRQFRCNVWQYE